MEAWSSPDALKKCKKELEGSPIMEKVEGPGTPSVLWNAMMHPLINMTIKGAIWYQGEANSGTVLAIMLGIIKLNVLFVIYKYNALRKVCAWISKMGTSVICTVGSPNSYNCTFPAMIDDWRAKWYNGSRNQTKPLFFGFVQVSSYIAWSARKSQAWRSD